VLHPVLLATVQKALRQSRQKIQLPIGFPQQQCAPIRTDPASIKTGHDLPRSAAFKSEAGLVTLCHSESRSFVGANFVWKLSYARRSGFLLDLL
jgi:hypothetical protein